jgi:hypothetical protein
MYLIKALTAIVAFAIMAFSTVSIAAEGDCQAGILKDLARGLEKSDLAKLLESPNLSEILDSLCSQTPIKPIVKHANLVGKNAPPPPPIDLSETDPSKKAALIQLYLSSQIKFAELSNEVAENLLCFDYAKSVSPSLSWADNIPSKTCGWPTADKVFRSDSKLGIIVRTNTDCNELQGQLSLYKEPLSLASPNRLRPLTIQSANPNLNPGNNLCYGAMPGEFPSKNLVFADIQFSSSDNSSNVGAQVALPEIHDYYNFGLSTGVIVSTIKNSAFAYQPGSIAPPTGTCNSSTCSVNQISGSDLVDPVLFLTYYINGVDPATKGSWRDVGLVFGISEKSPSTNFYFGFAAEPIRNIAFVLGVNSGQVTQANQFDPGPASGRPNPVTQTAIKYGKFIGVNFNFSNFIASAFSGKGP